MASNADPGCFTISLECQQFANVSRILSGTNTRAANDYLDLTFSGMVVAATIDSFVECDALVSISNGQLDISH